MAGVIPHRSEHPVNQFLLIAADLVAVTLLVVMFFVRHRRR